MKQQPHADDARAVAIVGISARFPGAPDKETFWRNQRSGKNCISEIPPERWRWQDVFGDPIREEAKTNSKWGGFLTDLDKFDPLYFGISPHEAELMDPQHRLFIKATWEAIWDAGYVPRGLAGSGLGVFVGVQFQEYQQLLLNAGVINARVCTGNAQTMLPNRVSYLLDAMGPSEAIDTSCSSSLVALHHAVGAIRAGSCDMAIAGGANLILVPDVHIMGSQMGVLSPSGHCRPLDAAADGYVRAEGIGAVFLKRLRDAVDDGDHIYAIIRGSAVNHGGRSNSLTGPRSEAQAAVMAAALRDAQIGAGSISYVEMHCTGTVVGDPVEFEAVRIAFERSRQEFGDAASDHECALASVKGNIGHLEAASGLAGVVNAALAMRHKWLPGMSGFAQLNPKIKLAGTPFYVNHDGGPWLLPGDDERRRALVNSFGFGGTNASVVLEEFQPAGNGPVEESPEPLVLPLSVSHATQLPKYCRNLKSGIESLLATDDRRPSLRDIAGTLRQGRESLPVRIALRVRNTAELIATLRSIISDDPRGGSVVMSAAAAREQDFPDYACRWLDGVDEKWPELPNSRRISLACVPWNDGAYWFVADGIPVNRPAAAAVAPTASRFVYLTPAWRESPLPPSRRTIGDQASILLIGEAPERLRQFKARLAEAASPTARIAAACLGQAGQHPIAGESMTALGVRETGLTDWFDELARGGMDPDVIFVLPGPRASAADGNGNGSGSGVDMEFLFRATRELLTRWHRRNIEVYYVAAHPPGASPDEGAIEAFAKSVHLENGRFLFNVLYPSATGPHDLPVEAIEEWQRADGDKPRIVKHESGSRFVLGLAASADLPAAEDAQQVRVREGGVYFMAGGAGEIGQRLAKELVARCGARVILAGRSEEGEMQPRLEPIRAVARDPEQVRYRQCDVTKLDQVQAAVQRTVQELGTIDGVFVLTTAHKDALIFNKSWADFLAVSACKVAGTRNIDLATRQLALDFFAVFSSQAVLGMAGGSDYAYGCEFQNQFVAWRNEAVRSGLRRGRSFAVNWSRWKWDKYVTKDFDDWIVSLGYDFLDVETGLSGFQRILASNEERIFALFGDPERILPNIDLEHGLLDAGANARRWQRAAPRKSGDDVQALLDKLSPSELESLAEELAAHESTPAPTAREPAAQSASGKAPAETLSEVKQALLAVLSRLLKIDEIGDDTDLPSLGVDSITAINVIAELEDRFGIEMHPNWLFQYPNVSSLTKQMADKLSAPEQHNVAVTP